MKKSGNVLFTIAYLAMAIPMFYLPRQGFFIGSFGVPYKYLLGMGIIALAVLHFLVTADLRTAIRCLKDSAALLWPYLFALFYSLLVWVLTAVDLRVMTKGFFYTAYQIIAILTAAGTICMFGKKGIYLQLTALVCALLMVSVQQIRLLGLGEFIRQYAVNIATFTGESGSAMRTFEKGEYCYAVGFFLAYFVMTVKEERTHRLLLVGTFLLFFLGLKRSAFLGIVSGIVLGLVISLFKNPKKLAVPIFLLCSCLVTGYIVWVYNGLFDWLEAIGVTTSGRNTLYSQIKDYYQMSPLYFGKGAGFVARAFSDGTISVGNSDFMVGDIHNDYLRQYIELGWIGYLVWFWLYTNKKVNHFFHNNGDALERRRGVIAFTMTLISCVTFMTENSLYCYYATLCMAITVMGYRHEEFVERTKLPGEEI